MKVTGYTLAILISASLTKAQTPIQPAKQDTIIPLSQRLKPNKEKPEIKTSNTKPAVEKNECCKCGRG